jgi:hypothetical protein
MAAPACCDAQDLDRDAPAAAASSLDGIPPELVELMDRVRRLPADLRRDLEPIVAEAQEHARFRGRVLSIARDALVRMRLDLESATRFHPRSSR